ncbi:HslJ Heat shock protein [Paracoccaceae bacterium]|jgi:heat shock protein HslJ
MRRFVFAFALAMSPVASPAEPIQDFEWRLLAIDGLLVDASVTTSLRIDAAGQVTGQASCNSYGAQNGAELPAFSLGPIRATRMACDKLTEEQVYFDALALMETMALDGDRTLILTGPQGRSMEFVLDRLDSLTTCKTCPPTE